MQVSAVSGTVATQSGATDARKERQDVHVVPNGDGWTLKLERHTMAMPTFKTQTEAMGYGIQIARQLAVSLIIHGADGRFREVWSY